MKELKKVDGKKDEKKQMICRGNICFLLLEYYGGRG